jgi:hypothetical protein
MEGISEVIYLLIYLFTYFSHMTCLSSSVACDRLFLDLRRPHIFQAEGEMRMSNYFIHSVILYEDEMLTFFPTYLNFFLLDNVRLLTLHRHFKIVDILPNIFYYFFLLDNVRLLKLHRHFRIKTNSKIISMQHLRVPRTVQYTYDYNKSQRGARRLNCTL